jgi:preprotein translocase subunit YajC
VPIQAPIEVAVVTYLPLIIVAFVLFGAYTLTRRNRQRLVEQQSQELAAIGFGTDVMTTSGLYGTVVGVNDDETVQLAIAPGVEVKWALAALRDVAALPSPTRADAPEIENDPTEPNDPSSSSGG